MRFNRDKFFEQLRRYIKRIRGAGLDQKTVDAINALLAAIEGDRGWIMSAGANEIVAVKMVANFLAQVMHETAYTFRPIKEFFNPQKLTKAQQRYVPSGYYGRGFIQITWVTNYKKASIKLGLGDELVKNPDKALEFEIAYEIAARGMREGWFTGKKLADYINAGGTDYRNARRIVNGLDRADELAHASASMEQFLRASLEAGEQAAPRGDLFDLDRDRDRDPVSAEPSGGTMEAESHAPSAIAPQAADTASPPPAPPVSPGVTAGAVTVQRVVQSLGSKVIAGGLPTGGVFSAILLAITGALRNPFVIGAIIVVGFLIGAWLWDRSKQRQHSAQMKLVEKAASQDENTVAIAPPPVKAE